MGSFNASLKTMGDTRGLPATVQLHEGRLTIAAGDTPIGDWALGDIGLEPTPKGYRLAAEGEQIIIEMERRDEFAEELAESSKKRKKAGLLSRKKTDSPGRHATRMNGVGTKASDEARAGEAPGEASSSGSAASGPAASGPAASGPAASGPAGSGPAASGPAASGAAPAEAPEASSEASSDEGSGPSAIPPSLIAAMREGRETAETEQPEPRPADPVGEAYSPGRPPGAPAMPSPPVPEPSRQVPSRPPAPRPSSTEPAAAPARVRPAPEKTTFFGRLVGWLDRTIDVTEKRWGPLLPNWVFNRIVFVLAAVLVVLAFVFRGVTSLVLLVFGVILLMIGGAAYTDDVMASKILPGRMTPTHVLMVGIGLVALGIGFGLLS